MPTVGVEGLGEGKGGGGGSAQPSINPHMAERVIVWVYEYVGLGDGGGEADYRFGSVIF